jgi:hypothetical protein
MQQSMTVFCLTQAISMCILRSLCIQRCLHFRTIINLFGVIGETLCYSLIAKAIFTLAKFNTIMCAILPPISRLP